MKFLFLISNLLMCINLHSKDFSKYSEADLEKELNTLEATHELLNPSEREAKVYIFSNDMNPKYFKKEKLKYKFYTDKVSQDD